MATDIPKHEVQVKNLQTKSVVLYPSLAQVVREITDIALKPGPNVVEIYGLTPTLDESSVQIDGQGQATVNEVTVDLVPNREIFEHVYPDSPDETVDWDDDEWQTHSHDEEGEREDVAKISKRLRELNFELEEAEQVCKTAENQLKILDQYCSTLKADSLATADLTDFLDTYGSQRMSQWKKRAEATMRAEELTKDIERTKRELREAEKEERKKRNQMEKESARERRLKALESEALKKEKALIKEERLKFWPKKVYRVTLYLEASVDTPLSSERSSIDPFPPNVDDFEEEYDTPETQVREKLVSLTLSYITREACWYPRYDISISSLKKVAQIDFKAEFLNATSETWRDTRISLSTSRTSCTGLEEKVPTLDPWAIKLNRFGGRNGALVSKQECQSSQSGDGASVDLDRGELFSAPLFISQLHAVKPKAKPEVHKNSFARYQAPQGQNAAQKNSLSQWAHVPVQFGKPGWSHASIDDKAVAQAQQPQSAPPFGLFGSSPDGKANAEDQRQFQTAQTQPAPALGLFASPATSTASKFGGFGSRIQSQTVGPQQLPSYGESAQPSSGSVTGGIFGVDNGPKLPVGDGTETSVTRLEYEESSWEDSGSNTSFDIASLRTLAPSSVPRRHKLATLQASDLQLSHVCVPKLRAAVFLSAKGQNPSGSLTLLRGTAGITLDGAFLGTLQFPQTGPSQQFELPLGIDPAVHVTYPAPTVRRRTTGALSLECAATYCRSITLTNAKSIPVDVRVLDQVPTSEDDRLKVQVLQPPGLNKVGDRIPAGAPLKEDDLTKNLAWGTGTAVLEKDARVQWDLTIEKGKACLLKLEYEARMPVTDTVVTA